MSKLVIVESPTKAKTIRKFLPKDCHVLASMGHVRDLPQSAADIPAAVKKEKWAQIGVNYDKNFEALYVIPKSKSKTIKELKDLLKDADELILATDEDREGESISWHLLEVLKPKVPVKRMVFHEITKEAILESFANTRHIDDKLVRAQETRRILDRLVGYTLSPLIWKKIAYGLSAGRVQSVAVRLIVERERERRAFLKGSYWGVKAGLSFDAKNFEATLTSVNGKRVAAGRDFDETTGKITVGKDVVLLGEKEAQDLCKQLPKEKWNVASIEEKPITRHPAPPFITSTLQQEANRKLRLSARDTMRTAQSLYENGLITYMRTDSVNLSAQAIDAARSCVEGMYGKDFLSDKPRQYTNKSKGAQEAHEAIRPAGSQFVHPKDTGLSGRELALYELIWKRTVATQMAPCQQTHITVTIAAGAAKFQTSGKRIDFAGFFRAYVEGSDDPDAAIDEQEVILPHFKQGDALSCEKVGATEHETKPPARYSEAALVKKLEGEGIGRPSTYASIIGTIVDRGYVVITANALTPTFTAFAVIKLLEQHFPNLVDVGFTSGMEQVLDDIASGDKEWLPYLKTFYLGKQGLKSRVEEHESEINPEEARSVDLVGLENTKIRISRYGAYLERPTVNGESVKANIPMDVAPADLNEVEIERLIKLKIDGPSSLGTDPESGQRVYVLVGMYGPYVQLGEATDDKSKPKRMSLSKGLKPEDVTLEQALALLSLPRTLGVHPETGKKIQATIGRFGPFIVHDKGTDGKDFRSVKAPDDVTTITLERALEILAVPKTGRGKRAPAQALRELGKHPVDSLPVAIFEGPYGLYVKHDKTNAGLPKEKKPEDVTLTEALEWLAERAKSPVKKKKRRRA